MSCIFYREKHRDWELVLPRIVQKLGKKKKKSKQEDEETDSLKQKIVRNNVEESDEETEQGSDSDEEFNSKTEKESVEKRDEEDEQRSGSDENLEQDSDSDDDLIPKKERGGVALRENQVEQRSDSEEKSEQDSGSDNSDRESGEEYDDGTDEDSNDENSNEDSDDELNSDENSFVASLKEALGKTNKLSSNSKVTKPRTSLKVDGESVVKMLDLKSQDVKIELMQTQEKADNSQLKTGEQKRSSFFLGGESESDNEDVEQSDAESNEDGEDMFKRNDGVIKKNFRPAFDKSKKRESDSHNHKRDQNFGGKRKQFQKVTSVKKSKFNKGSDRPLNAPAEDRTQNKYVVKNNTEIKVKQNDPNKTVNVHPSWEAKQKQKPSIQTFQGKKTVFE